MARAKKEAALTPEERLQAALVPDWEWPYKLPGNWCWTNWGECGEFVAGSGFKNEYQGFTNYDIPFYKVSSLKTANETGYLCDNTNTIDETVRKKLKAALIPANTLESFLKAVSNESDQSLPSFPKRKYNYCDEGMTPIYLVAILCGQDSFEKDYLVNACRFNEIQCMNMVIDTDKVENIFGRGRFDGDMPTGLYYLTDFIDHRITDLLRRGLLYSAAGKSYFEIKGLEKLGLDSIAILEFFEKLYSLFDARFEVTVTQGNSIVKCKSMSEGQRQLIKILGMLGICKTEDCLVLMDEPDAYMNPRWKYDIKSTMDQSLKGAINAQAIIATHDPLVINGVPKEFIRIFTQNKELESSTGFFVTRVITPVEDTEGMGIDGLLQSEYYGLQTSYDQKSHKKFLRRQELYLKLIGGNATAGEKAELREITRDLGLLPLSYNSIDFLYDDFLTVYKKCDLYSQEYLTYDQVLERRGKIKEIIEALYEGQV